MTFYEKAKMEHPELRDDPKGGLEGCPHHYGYEDNGTACPFIGHNEVSCADCWIREIPETGNTEPVILTYKFDDVVNAQLDRCKSIMIDKAKEYAQDTDRLHNFHAAAGMMGCGTKEALAGMMAKHTISVYDMCRSGEKYPVELWDEKITDHINYLLLLRAAVEEEGG